MLCDCGKQMLAIQAGIFLCGGCGISMEVGPTAEWKKNDWLKQMDKNVPGLKDWVLLFLESRGKPVDPLWTS